MIKIINFNLNLIILGYQKYLPVNDLFKYFNISIDEYNEVLNTFQRNIKNSKKYISSDFYRNKTINIAINLL